MFLWHIDEPQSALQMRRQASHVFSGERDGTAPRRKKPQHRLQQRRLAHSILADNCEDLGLRQREANIANHLRRTIAARQPFDLECIGHGPTSDAVCCWPVYISRTSALFTPSSTDPSRAILPWCSTMIRDDISRTKSRSCSTSRMNRRARDASVVRISAKPLRSARVRPAVGSSSSKTFGSSERTI